MGNVAYSGLTARDGSLTVLARSVLTEALRVTADEFVDPLVTLRELTDESDSRRRENGIVIKYFIDAERQEFAINDGVAQPDASGRLQALALNEEMSQASKLQANIRFVADEIGAVSLFGSATVAEVSASNNRVSGERKAGLRDSCNRNCSQKCLVDGPDQMMGSDF